VQRFPADYRFLGNATENSVMVGNAVPVNVAHWLATRVKAVLN
jgi:site-specific DNA-cytosine methylase